jgi:hypothetical protein
MLQNGIKKQKRIFLISALAFQKRLPRGPSKKREAEAGKKDRKPRKVISEQKSHFFFGGVSGLSLSSHTLSRVCVWRDGTLLVHRPRYLTVSYPASYIGVRSIHDMYITVILYLHHMVERLLQYTFPLEVRALYLWIRK